MNTPRYEKKDLLSIPEGKTFDRKSASYDLNKLANILIAFANADGGTVALGIKDKKYEGVNLLSSQKKNDILQLGSQRVVPTLEIEKNVKHILNNQGLPDEVWLLTVKPTDNKLYMNKKDEVYLRIGDETHHTTFEERKNLEFDKGIRAFESQAIDEAILDDLDEETVDKYKEMYGFDGDNLWDLLFPKGLAKRIRDKNDQIYYRLTVAGVLLLSKYPTAFIPGARIRFIRYEGKEAKTGSDMNIVKQIRIEGPLDKMLQQSSDILESQLRTFSSLDTKSGKFVDVPEYPKGAWLEGIVNAVVHRGYNYTGDDIRVLMFDDRLEIHSPGSLPAVVTTENIRRTHYSRNPYIARALTDFGWVREFGEGVDRIYKDMNEFFLDNPIYEVDANSVNLVLKNNIIMRSFRKNDDLESKIGKDWQQLNFIEHTAIGLAYEHGSVRTRELYEGINGYSMSSARNALNHLTKMGIFERVASAPTSPNQYYKLIK
ncbi:ATP-binding protein [Companilactobacillus nantensis]|uniref:Atp-dependent dna helicase recg n=1 Tax=Companilactobacillus nantensis DSM 16982 TaxID=1423774 RepID=A0A0R1WGU3_9LACO|nr:ATP-binding protein [Companilactobacillus nantensis]KRM15476.1 atp-dependent dna helicase recg [Companilactobacillus nantensis DSM 16982]GEO64355.1 ATP-dependent DNA helicase RecG [Companilactobacillus nantensis]